MAAAEQRRYDIKPGVVCGGSDKPYVTGFDVGQKQILLCLVKAMNFVDEEDGAVLRPVAGKFQNIADFRNVGKHCAHTDKPAAGFMRYSPGQGGFSASRRPPKKDTSE